MPRNIFFLQPIQGTYVEVGFKNLHFLKVFTKKNFLKLQKSEF